MKFIDALLAIKSGNKVRRIGWNKEHYLYYRDDYVFEHFPSGNETAFETLLNLCIDAWVLVSEDQT